MNDNKTQLVLAFIVTGVVLIGLGFFLTKKSRHVPANPNRLASVQLQSGQAFAIRSGYAQREKVSDKLWLFSLDSIETTEASEVLLGFECAYRVTLLENTLVTLEQIRRDSGEHIDLILKRGEIRIENFGREGCLYIAKNGERVPAPEYNGSKLASAPILTSDNPEEQTAPAEALQGLSPDEIAATMAQNKGTLFKCYTQSLQKNASYKGDVSLSFTIENNGRVSNAEVASSQIDDADFKNCLVDIVKRIQFKSFSGTPISTMSPIRFE